MRYLIVKPSSLGDILHAMPAVSALSRAQPDAEVDWDGSTIYVHCDEVPHPVAVRYGFRNWMGANLQTSMGIPVPPFRTDDWGL